ncbi:MAG: branched-chain amino acid ABC transporter substrate-binding protein, partial [Burkholderiaceae bacterium]
MKSLIAVAVAAFVVGCSKKEAESTVKIGHVGPLTGGIAHLGKDNEAGAKLAIADLNAAKI